MRLAPFAFSLLLPAASWAGVATVVDDHIATGYQRFAQAGANLSAAAEADCQAESLQKPYHAAFDAWLGVSHIRFGPVEEDGLGLTLAFWPDPKNRTGKAMTRLMNTEDPVVENPAGFQEVSAAARGLYALERLLFETDSTDYGVESYACKFVQAIAADIAGSGASLARDWPTHGRALKTAGSDGNTTYLSASEAQGTLYTALSTGLEFLHDQRLGRPLGTFDRPRPRQAEARRSERSLRNIVLSLTALREMTVAFADEKAPRTLKAFDVAIARAQSLDDPALQSVGDPIERIKIEVLQQMVRQIQIEVIEEIGRGLGVTAGFNSLDGD